MSFVKLSGVYVTAHVCSCVCLFFLCVPVCISVTYDCECAFRRVRVGMLNSQLGFGGVRTCAVRRPLFLRTKRC